MDSSVSSRSILLMLTNLPYRIDSRLAQQEETLAGLDVSPYSNITFPPTTTTMASVAMSCLTMALEIAASRWASYPIVSGATEGMSTAASSRLSAEPEVE